MSIWTALILITLCALLWDVGIVLQKLAVDRVPRIGLDRAFPAALLSLVKSGRWMAGLAASAIGWGLFALALASTPVSVARAIQGSGFVILAVFSLIFLRHRLSAREWIGVALVTSGIVALGIADSSSGSVQSKISLGRLIPALAAGRDLHRHRRPRRSAGSGPPPARARRHGLRGDRCRRRVSFPVLGRGDSGPACEIAGLPFARGVRDP